MKKVKNWFIALIFFVLLISFTSAVEKRFVFDRIGERTEFQNYIYQLNDISSKSIKLKVWRIFRETAPSYIIINEKEFVKPFNSFIFLNKVYYNSPNDFFAEVNFSTEEKTHRECKNQQCIRVWGNEEDNCLIDDDCINIHLECRNQQCIQVGGRGRDSCLIDDDCITHRECRNQQCIEITGYGENQCLSNSDCNQESNNEGEYRTDIQRIVYAGGLHFSSYENNNTLMELLENMSKSNPRYNAILLSSFQLVNKSYVSKSEEKIRIFERNVNNFINKAKSLNIKVYANAIYPSEMLFFNPNLAEGSIVKNANFSVERTEEGMLVAIFQKESLIEKEDGGFELVDEKGFKNWNKRSLNESFNKYIFNDSEIKKTGKYSMKLKYDYPPNSQEKKSIRIFRRVNVTPFTQYRVKVSIKTENYSTPQTIEYSIRDPHKTHLPLAKIINPVYKPFISKNQDWIDYYSSFNSGNNTFVYFFLGSWNSGNGSVWFDDLEIESTAVNVLNTTECPIVVKDYYSGTTYIEGRDFIFKDPQLRELKLIHSNPVIEIPSGSRIQEGQKLSVDFCAAITYKPFPSLTNPETFNVFRTYLRNLNSLIPELSGVVVGADELRVLNNINPVPGRTPGMILSLASKRLAEIAKQINPNWELIYWSDMYDPQMNQKNGYYLTNGPLKDSEVWLPENAIILDWNVKAGRENKESRLASRNWFSNLGMRFVIAGYSDSLTGLNEITEYVREAKDIPGYYGYMYTTWTKNYDNLEEYAQNAGRGE